MKKTILKGKGARAAILNGINLVADCVKVTLGPNGRNAILGRISQTPLITNDGVTIADYVETENETEQLGVMLVKEVSRLTEKSSGDGTTTATVLLQVLVNKCIGLIDNDDSLLKSKRINPLQLRREIDEACKKIVAELKSTAKPISTKKEILHVAKVSVEDAELAELLAEIFFSIGKDGVIVVEEGDTKTEHEVVKGLELPSGLVSEHLVTGDGEFRAENPKILVTTDKVSKIDMLLPILETLSSKGILKLVIVAKDFDESVIKVIEKNHISDVFTILPVKVTDIAKKYQQEDVSALTGARVVTLNETIKLEDLGTCESVVATNEKTVFIGGKGNDEYLLKLKKEQEKASSEFEKDTIGRRISSLSGGIAIIKVGASSQSEREYLKLKLDDAVLAVKYAMQDGVVKGGGVALKDIAMKLEPSVLSDVIIAPCNQIQENSGGTLEIGKDVIDPVRVTISALQNACSVGGIVITSEVAISNKDEKQTIKEEN